MAEGEDESHGQGRRQEQEALVLRQSAVQALLGLTPAQDGHEPAEDGEENGHGAELLEGQDIGEDILPGPLPVGATEGEVVVGLHGGVIVVCGSGHEPVHEPEEALIALEGQGDEQDDGESGEGREHRVPEVLPRLLLPPADQEQVGHGVHRPEHEGLPLGHDREAEDRAGKDAVPVHGAGLRIEKQQEADHQPQGQDGIDLAPGPREEQQGRVQEHQAAQDEGTGVVDTLLPGKAHEKERKEQVRRDGREHVEEDAQNRARVHAEQVQHRRIPAQEQHIARGIVVPVVASRPVKLLGTVAGDVLAPADEAAHVAVVAPIEGAENEPKEQPHHHDECESAPVALFGQGPAGKQLSVAIDPEDQQDAGEHRRPDDDGKEGLVVLLVPEGVVVIVVAGTAPGFEKLVAALVCSAGAQGHVLEPNGAGTRLGVAAQPQGQDDLGLARLRFKI